MEAVTEAERLMDEPRKPAFARHVAGLAGACALAAALAACDLPFGLGLPSTRALEAGAAASLGESRFEVSGTYWESGEKWSVDVQLERPDREHVLVNGSKLKLEAIVIGSSAYFRGQDFLVAHVGTDPLAQNLIKAAGNAWWKGTAGLLPSLSELTAAPSFQQTFLGPAVSRRIDHVAVAGVDAAELSGARGDVYIGLAAPYPLLRVQFSGRVTIDGLEYADLVYGSYGHDFGIAAPADVIDFSNLSTLPPIYSVISVDTSKCGSPCAVSATLKNLGGLKGAKAPSTITFTMTSTANNAVIGSCQAQVVPDVGYNATTTVSCTISSLSQPANAAIVTATADNPGRG
jgi:hypothetical protein